MKAIKQVGIRGWVTSLKEWVKLSVDSSGDLKISTTKTPAVYNVTLTDADTEYSLALPSNTRELRFRCRTLFDVRYSFSTGKVATPTTPYLTLPAGSDYSSDGSDITGKTLYFASDEAGVVVEVELWT